MKNVFSVAFIAILSLTAILYSCQKPQELANPSTTIVQDNIKTRTDYGVTHNRVMDDVYNSMLQNKDLPDMTQEQLKNIAYSTFSQSIASQLGLSTSTINDFLQYSNIPSNYSSYPSYMSDYRTTMVNGLNSINDDQLKDAYTELLNGVDNVNSYEEYVDLVNSLKQQFVGTSNESIFNVVSSISTSSFSYWADNSQNWLNLNLQNVQAKQLDPRFKQIVKGDIYGAINGGLAGAGFAGVGALAGACLGASYGSAIEGLFVAFGW